MKYATHSLLLALILFAPKSESKPDHYGNWRLQFFQMCMAVSGVQTYRPVANPEIPKVLKLCNELSKEWLDEILETTPPRDNKTKKP